MGGLKRVLWCLLLCLQGLQLSNAGSRCPLVKSAAAVPSQFEASNVKTLLRCVGGVKSASHFDAGSLRLRGGLEMKLDRTAEEVTAQEGRTAQSVNKRSRSPEQDRPSVSPSAQSRVSGGPPTPKRTRVRSASADRRRRNRSASPRVGYAYAGKGNVWRSGTALGLSGLNVPCEGRLEEPIIDVFDTMDEISWPHRTIKELRNDGMDADDITFLKGDDVTPIGKAAKDWARHTLGLPRRGRDGRGKTPASLARAQARMAEITASLRTLSPSGNETRGAGDGEAEGRDSEEALFKRRVLVCDLPEGTTEEDVQQCMSAFGKVEAVRIQRVVLFACVTFASEAARTEALRRSFVNFRGFQLDLKPAPMFNSAGEKERHQPNTQVMVSRARGRAIETPGTGIKNIARLVERGLAETDDKGELKELPWSQNTIVVHGLSPSTNETDIRRAFARCGRIAYASLADVVEGKSKYAVVKFYSEESLQRAGLMDGTKIKGQEVRIREQGQTKSFIEALNDRNTVNEDDETAYYLQTQNMPGSGQKK